jgi:biopolymer transport protein TolQ
MSGCRNQIRGSPRGNFVDRPGHSPITLPMPAVLTSPPILALLDLYGIFMQSDIVGKVITVLLAFFSIVAWAVMWGKHRDLKELRRLNLIFEDRLRQEASVLQQPESTPQRFIPYADLFADAVEAYWRATAISREKGVNDPRSRLEQAENALQRALARQTLRYESNMVFLASIVSGAPFLGLLGTVWGVMTAFAAISVQASATIQSMAPGVAAALLTTIAGLVVAIPSVFGYNYLFANTKRLITELENFASALADRIELEAQ